MIHNIQLHSSFLHITIYHHKYEADIYIVYLYCVYIFTEMFCVKSTSIITLRSYISLVPSVQKKKKHFSHTSHKFRDFIKAHSLTRVFIWGHPGKLDKIKCGSLSFDLLPPFFFQCSDGKPDHPSTGADWGLEENSQSAG